MFQGLHCFLDWKKYFKTNKSPACYFQMGTGNALGEKTWSYTGW